MALDLFVVAQSTALRSKPVDLYRTGHSHIQLTTHHRLAVLRLNGNPPKRDDLVTIADQLLRAVASNGCDVAILHHVHGSQHGPQSLRLGSYLKATSDLLESLAFACHGAGLRLWITIPDGWAAYQRILQLDESSSQAHVQHRTCADMPTALQLAADWQRLHPTAELLPQLALGHRWLGFQPNTPTLN